MLPLLAVAVVTSIPWGQLGVGVAACAALVYVARAITKGVSTVVALVRDISKDNQTFIGNHMSGVTSALADVAKTTAVMAERVDRLHDDNVETAQVLKAADDTVRRLVDSANPPVARRRKV